MLKCIKTIPEGLIKATNKWYIKSRLPKLVKEFLFLIFILSAVFLNRLVDFISVKSASKPIVK